LRHERGRCRRVVMVATIGGRFVRAGARVRESGLRAMR
jgi:hypothetical protein